MGNVIVVDKVLWVLFSDGENMVLINVVDVLLLLVLLCSWEDWLWLQVQLENGCVWVSCSMEYVGDVGDGVELEGLQCEQIIQVLVLCVECGLMCVCYVGKINLGFVEMMWCLVVVVDQQKIYKCIFDLDFSGGQVELVIVVGDSIGELGWIIWVCEGLICYSVCVFVLVVGDNCLLLGKVGIYCMMCISFKVILCVEFNCELYEVYDNVKDYL